MEYVKTPIIRTIQDKVNYHLWKKSGDAAKQLSLMLSREVVASFLTIQSSYSDLLYETANIQLRYPLALILRAQPYDVSPVAKQFFQFFDAGSQMVNTSVMKVAGLQYTYSTTVTILQTVLSQLLERLNATAPTNAARSYALSAYYCSLGFLLNLFPTAVVDSPETTLRCLMAVSLMGERCDELVLPENRNDVKKVTSIVYHLFMNNDTLRSIRPSPELLSFLATRIQTDSSWTKRLFYITLLTELQLNGAEVNVTPDLLASVLRLNNKVVLKGSVRLFVLNPTVFCEAVSLLSEDQRVAAIRQLVRDGYTSYSDGSTSNSHNQDSFSKEIILFLSRQLEISCSFSVMDFPAADAFKMNNSARFVLQLFRVDMASLYHLDPCRSERAVPGSCVAAVRGTVRLCGGGEEVRHCDDVDGVFRAGHIRGPYGRVFSRRGAFHSIHCTGKRSAQLVPDVFSPLRAAVFHRARNAAFRYKESVLPPYVRMVASRNERGFCKNPSHSTCMFMTYILLFIFIHDHNRQISFANPNITAEKSGLQLASMINLDMIFGVCKLPADLVRLSSLCDS